MTHEYYDYSSDDEVIEFRRRNDEARKARQKARQQIFEESEKTDEKNVRQMARDARSRLYDDYYEAAHKSKVQDRKTLEYIDAILNETASPYGKLRKSTAPVPGLVRLRKNRLGSQSDHHIASGAARSDDESDIERRPKRYQPRSHSSRKAKPTIHSNTFEDEYDEYDVEPRPTIVKQPSESAMRRVRRIEARLEGILDYELPSADNFKHMRHSLREINDKMATHKLLMDRRKNYTEDEDIGEVSERIDQKYRELEERMPCLSVSERGSHRRNSVGFDPTLIPGYVTGLSITNSEQTSELRGRIRTLLCRTRRTAASDDKHTSLARRRREIAVK